MLRALFVLGYSIFFLGVVTGSASADLVAHWRLNEGEGEIFADTAAGNDGFLPDGVTIEWMDDGPLEGVLDSSVFFDGDSGPSFIETPYFGVGGNNPRTITAWVKAEPQARATAVVAYGSLATARKWHFRIENTRIRTEFQGGQNFGGDTDVADGTWHHIASVFPEGATEGADILHYVDGILEPQLGGTSQPIDTGNTEEDAAFPVNIGFAVGHDGRWFQGQISDVRFYDEGLDADAILAIASGAGLLPPDTLLGDFNGDGNVDTADFLILSENFNTRPGSDSYSRGDFDQNQRVDLNDFLKFRKVFNSAEAASSHAVPEPSSLSMAVGSLGLLLLRKRRATRIC